ncbi:MAG: hypothetical protein LBE13_00840 [Bacteroidales bacterium]|jgi:hypothetical protein|nr:hypothetical protein [Bacteroidales bacterium]
MKKTTIILFIGLFALACNENKRKIGVQQMITEWVGKTIQFPKGISCFSINGDSLDYSCENLLHKKYKILLPIDSSGCTDCRLKLFEWKRLIAEADTTLNAQLSFLFFFQPKNKSEIFFLLRSNQFDYPVFLDCNNEINQLNHFPTEEIYQCFLLNQSNKVLMIGNPVLNSKVWELYKQTISGVEK